MLDRFKAAGIDIWTQRRHLYATIAVVAMIATSWHYKGNDYLQLLYALQLELKGVSAYGPAMTALFQQTYPEFIQIGMPYPLPAMWLALPLIPLPELVRHITWILLSTGSLWLGVYLLRMPEPLLFFMPILMNCLDGQPTMLLVGLCMIGIWAARERRWWLTALIVALTIASKPQATLILASIPAWMALRAGAWRQMLIMGAIFIGMTWLIEPTWVQQLLIVVMRYRANVSSVSVLLWLVMVPVLLILRAPLAAAAVIQVALFPISFKYALLPLLVGYIDVKSYRVAWIAVICSWLLWSQGDFNWPWLDIGLCYVVPLLGAAVWSANERKLFGTGALPLGRFMRRQRGVYDDQHLHGETQIGDERD